MIPIDPRHSVIKGLNCTKFSCTRSFLRSLFCPLQGDTVETSGQDLADFMNQLKGL